MTNDKLILMQIKRSELIRRLDMGYFDPSEWKKAIYLAHEYHCEAIASQLEQYFKHYEMETN